MPHASRVVLWWLVGFAGTTTRALLLRSSDGGQTWTDLSNGLASLETSQTKLHTGFALDAEHIWVGGGRGAFFYSSTGGE